MLKLVPSVPLNDWIGIWESCYAGTDYDEDAYSQAMTSLADADGTTLIPALIKAFEWKNGRNLNAQKKEKVQAVCFKQWSAWQARSSIPVYFSSGAIWDIFLLHLASGGQKPIFDQHTWRAYCFIHSKLKPKDELGNRDQIITLYNEYSNWFLSLGLSPKKSRIADKALMAFGQFLRSQFKSLLSLPSFA